MRARCRCDASSVALPFLEKPARREEKAASGERPQALTAVTRKSVVEAGDGLSLSGVAAHKVRDVIQAVRIRNRVRS